MTGVVRYRCPACDCHTLTRRGHWEICLLCRWEDDPYAARFSDNEPWDGGANHMRLSEGCKLVNENGLALKPNHPLFFELRHPILGPRGETVIDRVLLRERAYFEFRERLKNDGDPAELPQRLIDLLDAIRAVDKLYVKD